MRQDFGSISENVDLVDLIRRFVPLNKTLNGPCPKCGGDDRFFVAKNRMHFGCRKCDFHGDAIDFVKHVYKLSTVEAVSFLTDGRYGESVKRMTPIERQKEQRKASNWDTATWQEEAKGIVSEACLRMKLETGQIAVDYLESRGILPETAETFKVGYIPDLYDPRDESLRPAISIPWLLSDGSIMAIKFRYIDLLASQSKSRRYRQKGGGDPILYGLHACRKREDILLIEGEINAMSAYQAVGDMMDIVSIGSDSSPVSIQQSMQLSKRYNRTFVWVDDKAKLDMIESTYKKSGTSIVKLSAIAAGRLGHIQADANHILSTRGQRVLQTLIRAKLHEGE